MSIDTAKEKMQGAWDSIGDSLRRVLPVVTVGALLAGCSNTSPKDYEAADPFATTGSLSRQIKNLEKKIDYNFEGTQGEADAIRKELGNQRETLERIEAKIDSLGLSRFSDNRTTRR